MTGILEQICQTKLNIWSNLEVHWLFLNYPLYFMVSFWKSHKNGKNCSETKWTPNPKWLYLQSSVVQGGGNLLWVKLINKWLASLLLQTNSKFTFLVSLFIFTTQHTQTLLCTFIYKPESQTKFLLGNLFLHFLCSVLSILQCILSRG